MALRDIPTNERTEAHILAKVRMVVADEASFGVLSTGEKIAVALVLDRPDLWKFWGTTLEALDRLGDTWLRAAYQVQRERLWEGA